MPPRVARLPRDARGFPIPAGNAVVAGVADFATLDMEKWAALLHRRACGICGETMFGPVYFIGGSLCARNRLFFDHPMHGACALYALKVCPYLALPNFMHRKTVPQHEGFMTEVIPRASDQKPARFMLGRTRSYAGHWHGADLLLRADPWLRVSWWHAGQEAAPP